MGTDGNRLLESSLAYRNAGLCILPARLAEKRPALTGWKAFQAALPNEQQICTWCAQAEAICIVTGAVSGRAEMIDFDCQGESFDAWRERVRREDPTLLDRLVIERSPSDGRHVVYRCETDVSGNLKLAQRRVVLPGPEQVILFGKPYKPRKETDGSWSVILTLIETRGEGGLFLCVPSPGYEPVQGDLTKLPVLTLRDREILLEAAWSLNEHWPQPTIPGPPPAPGMDGVRPGDDYNRRGDVRELLRKHGWTLARPGENEYWRRPGKEHGWSATLKDGTLYVFSSNGAPFEPDKAYSPFAVYALLEHDGDFTTAASALRNQGFGQDLPPASADVDLSGITQGGGRKGGPVEPSPEDPGLMPAELLRIPGFISEVMDHSLDTAPYPNQVMAFCGAVALQAFLAGRKVRDPGDNRTNIYLLGLGHSAAGKDWPRKVNTRILYEIGMEECLGDRFASGEGIQDALFLNPCMLFQTDEIDGMLQSINRAKDARHENIMGTLLTMYSSANSVFPMRRKAGKESPGVIDQPCLVIFGTAIPNHYYEALSERMLTNGFFARMIILEGGPRPKGKEPRSSDPPPRILETARWWTEYQPGAGNLEKCHPGPSIVEQTEEAKQALVETREQADAEYALAEGRGDPVGTTVWGRVSEQTRKLALLYAVSANHESPRIDLAAVQWAARFVMHQTRRMLFMAHEHVSEGSFQAECLKLLRKLREAPGRQLPHSILLKRMKTDAKRFVDLVTTLEQRGDIEIQTGLSDGRPGRSYRLARGPEDGGEK